jgi:3-methyladenine DNA glycosylase AlkC
MADASGAAPALKEIFDRARFREIGAAMAAIHPGFDAKRFVQAGTRDLDALGIMQRLRRMAETLHAAMGLDFAEAVAALKLLAPRIGHNFVGIVPSEYVALYGRGQGRTALDALAHFTGFGTAEFAIRPFLADDLAGTLGVMRGWAGHDDEHVRRLASEGSRPRLPWAARLDAVIADPGLTWPILDQLKTDPSLYVRRSVANHLNDLTKDHPGWVLDRVAAWPLDQPHTAWIVRHALRSLIKQGNPVALGLIGATGKPQVETRFAVTPARIRLGDTVTLEARLASTAAEAQRLVIDYAVHYVKKNGSPSRKVFKLKGCTLAPGEVLEISRRQTVRDFSTRVHYPGRHDVELLVNGETAARGFFDLKT